MTDLLISGRVETIADATSWPQTSAAGIPSRGSRDRHTRRSAILRRGFERDTVDLLYPSIGHPAGPSNRAWFLISSIFVYAAYGHPEGASGLPWYSLSRGYLYPDCRHPDNGSPDPHFEIRDNLVFPAVGHPTGIGVVPWYQRLRGVLV